MSTPLSILITGSSSGFGRLTAEALARKGHTVFASMRGVNGKNAEKAAQLRQWAEQEDVNLHVLELDVTDEASAEAAAAAVVAAAGRIDVLINNAGIGAFGLNEAFTTGQLQSMFDVNVFGVHRVNRAVLPTMREQQSGLLVYVTSALGRFMVPNMGTYSASKFAVEALAESYHYNLSNLGIDTVIVEPTGFATDGFYTLGQLPADGERAAAYGAVAETLQQFGEGYAQSLQAPDAPQPQQVVDVIVNLIETPVGERPLRTTVGNFLEGVQVINQTTDQVQAQTFAALGLDALLKVAIPVV
jgi:NAD(P)-dependent dehydrogenase (short-subunit alcohol dehydrogenase family)